MIKFNSESVEQTIAFATEYSKTLKGGDVVLLNGEMGAGKTVFVKGIAQGLGIDDEILSPTYAYMNDYYGKLYHYDCYRLSCGEQAERLGLTDYFYADGICVIEWAENISDALPANCKTVTINKKGTFEREIICE
ncbi:MAG: tRNA (adenosine(37)-N6)-threonylcarbamoyltransferase complex ATPase subunit type 1 TsaE [Candidatus Coproplasma sp.]